MSSRSLQRLVQDHGLKPKDMADLFGVTERTWYNWTEHPELHMTIGRICVMADALRISEWEIFQAVRRRK